MTLKLKLHAHSGSLIKIVIIKTTSTSNMCMTMCHGSYIIQTILFVPIFFRFAIFFDLFSHVPFLRIFITFYSSILGIFYFMVVMHSSNLSLLKGGDRPYKNPKKGRRCYFMVQLVSVFF